MRWLFGLIAPAGYERERCCLSAQILLQGSCQLEARARFLLPAREEQGVCEVAPGSFCQGEVAGRFELVTEALEPDLWRVHLSLHNDSPWRGEDRGEALLHSLASTQLVLHSPGGRFLSCQDPLPPHACRQEGWWPVLFDDHSVLVSPILLNDFPRVAPESPADAYDATEIEQLLQLSVLALSDQERVEARVLPQTRAIVERAEGLEAEQFMQYHGTFRDLQPGMRVRLRPQPGRDILDLVLDGMIGRIQCIEVDLEGRNYVAVTLDEDPGRDLGERGWPGHRFFLDPEEVERL